MDKQVQKVLEGMATDLESLRGTSENLETRLKAVEGDMATMKDSRPDPHSDDTSSSEEEVAKLHEETLEENALIKDRVEQLESEEHENEIIQAFLQDLDADNYFEIGRKLEYIEVTEPTLEDLQKLEPGEFTLGDSGKKLQISKEKPEDMTGWAYSETQDLYVKVV